MRKKILVLALAFAMMLAFAACGGSSGSEEAAPAEANTGVGGIVFAMPDGWTQASSSVGRYLEFKNPDSPYTVYASIFDDKALEDMNKWNSERSAASVQEYYEKYYTSTEALSKEGLENSVVQVCDTDAQYNKFKTDGGSYLELGTSWMYEDKIYNISMFNPDSYGDDGKVVEGATPLADEDIAMYEGIIASVKPGDGTALQTAAMTADSVGSISFQAPAGYTLTDIYENGVTFKKDGSEITLQFSCTGEEDLQYMSDENGEHPESLKEWYEKFLYEGVEKTTIAGFDGHIDKFPDENDKYYNCSAEFLGDDCIYDAYIGSEAYDENGNLKDDAEELTAEDLAVFDTFIASLKKK